MPLLEEVVSLVRPLAERRRVTIDFELDATAPPVHYDGNAMHQALLNLLLNAVEAVPSKSGSFDCVPCGMRNASPPPSWWRTMA